MLQTVKCPLLESGKVTLDPRPEPDQHRNLTTSTGSSLTHAYQVWSTSINGFVSYIADRWTHRHMMITIQWCPSLYRDARMI